MSSKRETCEDYVWTYIFEEYLVLQVPSRLVLIYASLESSNGWIFFEEINIYVIHFTQAPQFIAIATFLLLLNFSMLHVDQRFNHLGSLYLV